MNAILQAFGRIVCGITKKHSWRKANKDGIKQCSRCPESRAVKRRKQKGDLNGN